MNLSNYSLEEALPWLILAAVVWCALTVVVFMWVMSKAKDNIIKRVEANYIPVTELEEITYSNAKRLALQLIEKRYIGKKIFHQYAKEFPHHSAKYLGQVFSETNAIESPLAVQNVLHNLTDRRFTITEIAA